jgi:hypothetical protein
MSVAFCRRIELLEQRKPADILPPEILAAREYRNDPLAFVMWAFPWGVPGIPLEMEHGPDE